MWFYRSPEQFAAAPRYVNVILAPDLPANLGQRLDEVLPVHRHNQGEGCHHHMVRFPAYSKAALGCIRRRACSHRRVQAESRALGRGQMQAPRDHLDRQRRLPPDEGRNS
jgi:hypothetical protein